MARSTLHSILLFKLVPAFVQSTKNRSSNESYLRARILWQLLNQSAQVHGEENR